jgi:hypothetical protein
MKWLQHLFSSFYANSSNKVGEEAERQCFSSTEQPLGLPFKIDTANTHDILQNSLKRSFFFFLFHFFSFFRFSKALAMPLRVHFFLSFLYRSSDPLTTRSLQRYPEAILVQKFQKTRLYLSLVWNLKISSVCVTMFVS